MKYLFVILIFVGSVFGNDIIIKESHHSVSQTVKKIKKILKAKDLKLFKIIKHSKAAKKAGMKMNKAKLIIFGNPKIGTMLMQKNVLIGLDLPMKILVYEDDNKKVKVAYRNGSWIKKEYGLDDERVTSILDKALNNITDKAIE